MQDWKRRFRGLYWRELAVTVGMVALTLVLLAAVFFSLSYSYLHRQRTQEMLDRAAAVSRSAEDYLTQRDAAPADGRQEAELRRFAQVASSFSETDVLVCATDGTVLLA
ncbi:MAG: two-component sensor histidine kinase, partial [Oscillibacter sp.]|nr:two-component sensor histidine kinase [Oscillibacter sp.]